MKSENQRWLTSPFLLPLAISLFLWSYAVVTTTIDYVPVANFPILQMMPPAYWAGVALLSGATVVWFLSAETRWYHFLLLLAWTLYIFTGPELVEVMARGFDATDHVFGATVIRLGRGSEWGIDDWPGFYVLSSFIYEATGIGFHHLVKLVAISLPLLRMVFIWYLASQLFREKRWTLLFSVLLIGSFWEGVSLDPSPQHLGLLLMLCLLALFFSTGQLNMRRRAVIIILFAALIYTHVLTPFMLALVIVFFSLMSLTKKDFGYSRSVSGYALGTLFLVGFTAYLMYTVEWVFKDSVDTLIRALQDPFGALILDPARSLAYKTQYRAFAVNLIWLYYGIMLVWMFIIAVRKEFRTKLSVERIFPLLCFIPLLPTILAYGIASLSRFYILGIPFILWFIARESRTLPKIVVSGFLIVLLLLSFGERYSLEYRNYVPSGEFVASRFIIDKIPSTAPVFREPDHDPWIGSQANIYITVDERPMVRYYPQLWRTIEEIKALGWPGLEAPKFGVWSPWTRNCFRYFYGDEELSLALKNLYGPERDVVYDSGYLQIYGYE